MVIGTNIKFHQCHRKLGKDHADRQKINILPLKFQYPLNTSKCDLSFLAREYYAKGYTTRRILEVWLNILIIVKGTFHFSTTYFSSRTQLKSVHILL